MMTNSLYRSTTFPSMSAGALVSHYQPIANRDMGGVKTIRTLTETFATEARAKAYVQAQIKDRGFALAVPVQKLTSKNQKRIAKLEQRKASLRDKIAHLPGERLNSLTYDEQILRNTRMTLTTRQCKGCQTRIQTRDLTGLDCPVCGKVDFIVTKSQQNHREKIVRQRQRWETQLAEANADIEAAITNNDPSPHGWYWYVGTWCEPSQGKTPEWQALCSSHPALSGQEQHEPTT